MSAAGEPRGGTAGGRLFELFLGPLERRGLAAFRALAAGGARGRVLELGAGTGANLGHYGPGLAELVLTDLELSPLLLRRARRFRHAAPLAADARRLPFPGSSFDTVVSTLVFCSVPDPAPAFAEIRRVLRPSGEWRFVEHVRPATAGLARAARVLTPAWRRVAGGCRLDLDSLSAIRAAGFRVELLGVAAGGALVAGRALPG